jgi:hypothetical protein
MTYDPENLPDDPQIDRAADDLHDEETAKCLVCGCVFVRSTEPSRRYVSCPAHSFGELVSDEEEREEEDPDAYHDEYQDY